MTEKVAPQSNEELASTLRDIKDSRAAAINAVSGDSFSDSGKLSGASST